MKTEKIMCAAIWVKNDHSVHRPTNIDTGVVICGYRHCNCMEFASFMFTRKEMAGCVQGFLTNNNRFVDRIEARKIAESCGQILGSEHTSKGNELYSEDVWLISHKGD
jgi:hypothetical protein